MGANFTPTLSGYSGQGAFRFWCQKVLPLVYDDSLSYMELLAKVVNYLNNTISDVANAEDNISKLANAYEELQDYVNEYFDNLDVQEEINRKLDEMAIDGTLNSYVAPLVPTLVSTWLNENVDPVGSAVIVDSSLQISGAAADSLVVGLELSDLREKGLNLWDASESVSGFLAPDGTITAGVNYRTSPLIPISPNRTYSKWINPTAFGGNAGYFWYYDSNGDFISRVMGIALDTNWYKTNDIPNNARYVRVSTVINDPKLLCEGAVAYSPSDYPEYGIKLQKDVTIDYSQVKNAPTPDNYYSILTGKKIVFKGDSATHGDFTSVEEPRFETGLYAGELKVYPYYIGNRTGAIIINDAVNGGTMAIAGSGHHIAEDGNYNNLDADTDYCIIWAGANDMWRNVPIGTIDSNDDTTFYGAWNKVLSYYVNNYPNMKLGIVVSFWLTSEYATAVKNIPNIFLILKVLSFC